MKKIFAILMGLAILASASQAVMIFGVDSVTGLGGSGLPYIGFMLNEDMRIDAGIQYTDVTETLGLYGRFTGKIYQVGKVKTYWGGALGITSTSGTTTININGLVGAEYKISDNLGLYGDVSILGLTSTDGTTNFMILSGSPLAYSGLRIYI